MHETNRFLSKIFYLLFLGKLLSSGQAQDVTTNLTVSGRADGTLDVSWKSPTTQTIDNYVLSYYTVQSQVINVTTKDTKVEIANAILGADYHFDLYCQTSGTTTAPTLCQSLNFSAFPSCPEGWYQHNIRCHYINGARSTWPESQAKCQALPSLLQSGQEVPRSTQETEINRIVNEELKVKKEALFWTTADECDGITKDVVSDHECCISLNASDNNSLAVKGNYRKCSQEQSLPFICSRYLKMMAPRAVNIVVTPESINTSVRIGWNDEKADDAHRWKVSWRTVSIFDNKHNVLGSEVGTVNVTFANLPPGAVYTAVITPHIRLFPEANADVAHFALIVPQDSQKKDVGFIQLPVPMRASLSWSAGAIVVTWDVAKLQTASGSVSSADSYQLLYGFLGARKQEYIKVNVTRVSYKIPSVQTNETYVFYLRCLFGEFVVGCGKIESFTVEPLSKLAFGGGGGYQGYDTVDTPTTWKDAEKTCKKYGGHITSITGKPDEDSIREFFSERQPFWIGASRCSGSSVQWSDGTPWQYNKLSNETAPSPNDCCVQAEFNTTTTVWKYTNCNTTLPALCKYNINDLGLLKSLTAVLKSSTSIQIKWKTTNLLWRVSTYKYTVCELNGTKTCPFLTGDVDISPVTISGLERKTAYSIQIEANVDLLDNTVNATTTITTGGSIDVMTNVSSEGKVALQWQGEKGADVVYVVQCRKPYGLPIRLINTTTYLQGLELGKMYNYSMLVIENKTGVILDYSEFVIISQPSCLQGEFQYDMKCYFIGNVSATWEDGRKSCHSREGGTAAQFVSTNDSQFLRSLSEDMGSSFWIDGRTSAISIDDDNDEEFRVLEMDGGHGPRRTARQVSGGGGGGGNGCRTITAEDNRTVVVTQCERHLPFMCQRKLTVDPGTVAEISMQNVSSTGMIITWASPPWKPTFIDIIITKSNSSSLAVASRKKREAEAVVNDDNSATIKNLDPGTAYNVDITPVLTTSSGEDIRGNTTSVKATTLGSQNGTSPPMAAAPLTGTPDNQDSDNKTIVEIRDDLRTFRIISCATFIVLTFVAFLVFAMCRMYKYRDCMSQMCFEVALLVAHVLILIDVDAREFIDCKSLAICIHYFFTAAFLFFALESFCNAKAMTKLVPVGVLNRTWQFFCIGWGVPAIIIVVSASVVHDEYIEKSRLNCWLNLDGKAMLATVIPIGIFAVLALVFLSLAICARPDDNYEVDEESYIRYEPLQDIRWMLLFIWCFLVCHWVFGMMALHEQDNSLAIAFIVLNIVLAIAILMLRCVGDDQVRYRVKHCCHSSAIGPGDDDLEKYLSHPYPKKGQGGDGMLIDRKIYIFRP